MAVAGPTRCSCAPGARQRGWPPRETRLQRGCGAGIDPRTDPFRPSPTLKEDIE